MQVVYLVIHHLLEVVVVGHVYRHGVGVCLASIKGLRIVSDVEFILIPVKRLTGWCIFLTAEVALSIFLGFEQFPTATDNLIAIRVDTRHTHRDAITRQHDVGFLNIFHRRNTVLKGHMDSHHMTLADRRDMGTTLIAFLIVVLVDDGDNLLLREVVEVGITAHIQRTCFHR